MDSFVSAFLYEQNGLESGFSRLEPICSEVFVVLKGQR